MKIVRTTYISLGSNEGDKLQNLQDAINLIGEKVGAVKKISSVYKTESWGFEGEDFYNICAKVSTNLNPESLLNNLLSIEQTLGRKRTDDKQYASRTIDLDILLFDDEIIFAPNLTVPHPRMLERKFVMVPLTEIAPNRKHPIEKQTILMCLQNCDDKTVIEKLS